MTFVQDFLFTAEDMHMTDPHEYAYLLTKHNSVHLSRPWQQGATQTARHGAASTFKPVLEV